MKLGGEFGPFICLWKPADWMRDWDNWPLIIELPEGFDPSDLQYLHILKFQVIHQM